MIPASDLGAWDYCPRQVYFRRVLGIKSEKKEVMVLGTMKHSIFESLIQKHKNTGSFDIDAVIEEVINEHMSDLVKFKTDIGFFRTQAKLSFSILEGKIKSGEFKVPEFCEEWLESKELGLKARVDVIFDHSGEWIVGDLKTSATDFQGTRMQIGAGALLFEKHNNVSIGRMKVISHMNWDEKEIHLTPELRNQILQARDDIMQMIETKKMPPLNENQNKCKVCDFRDSHCNEKKSLLNKIFG